MSDDIDMSLSEFAWEVACPNPENGNLVFFDLEDPQLYMAVETRLDSGTAKQLAQFLQNFTLIYLYLGLNQTISRIARIYTEREMSLEQSWIRSLLAVHMVTHGASSLTTEIIYEYARYAQQTQEKLPFICQISPLHGWALHESADFFLRDLLPQMENQGGYPIENVSNLASYAQAVRSHFRAIADYFSGERNPYFRIAELTEEISEPKM